MIPKILDTALTVANSK